MYVERFVQRIPYGHFVRENVELSEHLMQGDINMVTKPTWDSFFLLAKCNYSHIGSSSLALALPPRGAYG